AKFRDYRAIGINRLSVGTQIRNHDHLNALGRVHADSGALPAGDIARRHGVDDRDLALMHRLPGLRLAHPRADSGHARALGPEHLSWYQLPLEPNTVFYSRPPQLPEDEVLWDIQEAGQARLAEAGYAQYEISAYARSGRRARHNLNYW